MENGKILEMTRACCPNHPDNKTRYVNGCSSDPEEATSCGVAGCSRDLVDKRDVHRSDGGLYITVHGRGAVWKRFCYMHFAEEAQAERAYELGL